MDHSKMTAKDYDDIISDSLENARQYSGCEPSDKDHALAIVIAELESEVSMYDMALELACSMIQEASDIHIDWRMHFLRYADAKNGE